MTNVSSEIFFFLFFVAVLLSQLQKKIMDNRGRGGSSYYTTWGQKRRDGGRYVEVRLVQQNRVQDFKKIFSRWVEPQGARRAGRSLWPRPIRLCHQRAASIFDWLVSRREALPSSVSWVVSVVAISKRSSHQGPLGIHEGIYFLLGLRIIRAPMHEVKCVHPRCWGIWLTPRPWPNPELGAGLAALM